MLNVAVLGAVSFFADLQSEIILPLLPLFVTQDLGLTAGFLGLLEGAAETTAAVCKYFSGYLCDRFGRHKWLMFAGYCLSVASKPLLAFTRTGPAVLALRVTDRLGKGVRTSPRDTLLASYTSEGTRAQAFGLHRALDSAGAVAGVLVLYYLLNYTPLTNREIIKFTALPGVLVAAAILLFVKQPPVTRCVRPPRLFDGTTIGPWWPFLPVHVCAAAGSLSYAFYILRAAELGLPPGVVPLAYLAFTAAQVVWPLPLGSLADRLGILPVLAGVYILQAGVMAAGVAVGRPWTVWPLFITYALQYQAFLVLPTAFVSKIVPAERRGGAIGTLHMVGGIVTLPSSLLAGAIWDRWGGNAAFVYGAALTCLAAVGTAVYHLARRTNPLGGGYEKRA